MAKKEKAPLSENMLKAWGAVAFVGLTGRLFYYVAKENEDAKREEQKAQRAIKKPWKVFFLSLFLALVVIALLVVGYLVLRHFCFPSYRMPIELIALISLLTVFVMGTVITVIEAKIHKQ